MRLLTLFVSGILVALLCGCTPLISAEMRKTVTNDLTFAQVKEHPASHVGQRLIVGGIIASTRNGKEGAEIEVVQMPLSATDVPAESLQSGGRFLATTTELLDPVLYAPGRMVVLLGEVKGEKIAPLDSVDYRYPLFTIRELHLLRALNEERGFPYPAMSPYYGFDPYGSSYAPGPAWYRPGGATIK